MAQPKQEGPVVVDHARTVGHRGKELLDIGGPGEAQDGATAEAELMGEDPRLSLRSMRSWIR
ncbi:hypothetical protein ACGFZQ_12975 [Streptomyces sp. NPDC048254]|uniref:hypothetical protein n=1 Tax=Streptomyces sp. NPDC048254 TaxID=3365525 RepID=UPI003717C279